MSEHIFLTHVIITPVQRRYLRSLFKRRIDDAKYNALVRALVESAETQQLADYDPVRDPQAAQRLEEVKKQAKKLGRCVAALGSHEKTMLNQLAGGTLPCVDDIAQAARELARDLSAPRGRQFDMKYIPALHALAQRFESIFDGEYRVSADESAVFVRVVDFFLLDLVGCDANANAQRECARLLAYRVRYMTPKTERV